jgi:hypothetical protein
MLRNASTRSGAFSIRVRRNSSKFTNPVVPASTTVVTPWFRQIAGSMPKALPSYQ